VNFQKYGKNEKQYKSMQAVNPAKHNGAAEQVIDKTERDLFTEH